MLLIDFNMCSICCSQYVKAILNFAPSVLQHFFAEVVYECKTSWTVLRGIASSFDAIRIDFLGLRWNATRTATTVINAWPTWSFAIQTAAGFHKFFKPSLDAVSVRRVFSKLTSKFTLYCSWWFQFMVPKNTLCFLLNGQHVSYFVANLRLY